MTLCICARAQNMVLTGTVVDAQTREPIAQASVVAEKGGVAVVTNDDGLFTLKSETHVAALTVSHLGYQSQRVVVDADNMEKVRVRLAPTSITLQELVVWTEDPRLLVKTAISKITDNYSQRPELYKCFYRETAKKRNHFIYVAEGVLDMYKTAYNRNTARDRVAIVKGRRLLSPKTSDTLTVKVMGGPVLPIQLDVAKNLDFLLNDEELDCYDLNMEMPATVNERLQYVVSLKPRVQTAYALFYGKLYIDRQTLAFSRAELSLDMSNRERATAFMLRRKPRVVRFRPKELTTTIDYRYEDGVTHIAYINNTFRFNCDWKRRLFATSFTVACEMVVTEHKTAEGKPISGRSSFDSRDAFYDKVDFFRDTDFWKDYNIIEPSETLDKAIGKLLKKYR